MREISLRDFFLFSSLCLPLSLSHSLLFSLPLFVRSSSASFSLLLCCQLEYDDCSERRLGSSSRHDATGMHRRATPADANTMTSSSLLHQPATPAALHAVSLNLSPFTFLLSLTHPDVDSMTTMPTHSVTTNV